MNDLNLMEQLRENLYKKFQKMNDNLYQNPNDRALKHEVNYQLDFITLLDQQISRLKNES